MSLRFPALLRLEGPAAFYLDIVGFPLLSILLFAVYCRSLGFAALALAGVVLFTLMEYWVHRVALHEIFYHGSHDRHHSHPAEYVVFPILMTPAIFAGFFMVFPLGVFAGLCVGYSWFLIWHHVLHHFDLTRWPRFVQRYAVWHLEHHRFDDRNFGITVPWWDMLFGTYRKPV